MKFITLPPQNSTYFFAQPPLFPFCLRVSVSEGSKKTKINHLVTWAPTSSSSLPPPPLHSPKIFPCLCLIVQPLPCLSPLVLNLGKSLAPSLPWFPPVFQSLFTQICYLAGTSATLSTSLQSPQWSPNCYILQPLSLHSTLLLIQSVVHRPGSRVSPGSLLQMRNLRPCPSPAESQRAF